MIGDAVKTFAGWVLRAVVYVAVWAAMLLWAVFAACRWVILWRPGRKAAV